ncbi:hypothetical protein ACFL5Q_07630 [Planctomycetota bacterium]
MTESTNGPSKSCGPQLLVADEPSPDWSPEQLRAYALKQHGEILAGEKLLTPSYWRLGHALVLAKQTHLYGKWSQYLEDLGISTTRASRARAIYQAFDRVEDVSDMTVEVAYAQRRRRESMTDKDARSASG